MADGVRIPMEVLVPFSALTPALMSPLANDEYPVAKLQHTIDEVFSFYVDDATALPSGTKDWTILRPRRAGFITAFQVWFSDTGTSGTANTFDIFKNGTTILTGVVSFTHSDADNTMKSGTLTTSTGVAIAADDRISIQTVKGTNNGVGPHVRALGYYIGG